MRSARFVALAVFVAALAGCSNAPPNPESTDATGTVTLPNCQPMKTGTIYFDAHGSGRDEFTQIQDGKFTVKGMIPGKYKVAVDVPDKMPKGKSSLAPAKFTNVKTSDLSAEIKSGSNTLTFDLR